MPVTNETQPTKPHLLLLW